MYQYYGPPMWPMPPSGNNNSDPFRILRKLERYEEAKRKKKEEEDKKNKEKKKPEPIKFSFLETFGLCIFFGPIAGMSYLYMLKYILHNVEIMLK